MHYFDVNVQNTERYGALGDTCCLMTGDSQRLHGNAMECFEQFQ